MAETFLHTHTATAEIPCWSLNMIPPRNQPWDPARGPARGPARDPARARHLYVCGWWRWCGSRLQAGPDACHSLSLLQGQLLAPARLGQRTLYTPHTGHQDTPGTDSLHSAVESCMKMETCGYQASSPSCSFTARQLMLRPNTILVTPTLLIRHKNGPPDMAGNKG